MKQKRYKIVELYRFGTSISDLNREYVISEVTIYKWVKSLSSIEGSSDSLTPTDIAEIQKENFRLEQEVEILKKAMTIFARK